MTALDLCGQLESVHTFEIIVLFTMYIRPIQAVQLASNMSITSAITKAEYYDGTYDAGQVSLRFATQELTGDYALYQNEPNPFKGQTTVLFTMPEASTATLSVHDVTGKVVAVRNISAMKGQNSEVFNRDQLG